eukprot:c13591_g1_i1.p1 GENE.c13591_g1_i1~~c13591_g1_i1.p1  ORF type:complete len:342 (+),score=144.06 c13591_g1_i1:35-1060(+)
MKKLDVSFGTSWDRRRQTGAVWFVSSLLPLAAFFWVVTLFLLFFPLTFILAVAYIIFIFLDKSHTNGSRKPWLRKYKIWEDFLNYFPIKLVKTAELDPKNKYVIGYHPHGIISFGAFGSFAGCATFSKLFPNIDVHLLTLPINFKIPFSREILLSLGLCDSNEKTCQNILARGPGSAIVLVVGGAQESLHAHPGENTVVLKPRKGFIRQAIQAGAHLVPCYGFGENDVYNTHSFPDHSLMHKIQMFCKKKLSFTIPVFSGRGMFLRGVPLYLPFRKPVTVVIGAPIPVPKVDPSIDLKKSEEGKKIVDELHEKYVKALNDLFNAHKKKSGGLPDSATLTIT